MIFVTGDTHGTMDWGKLHKEAWPLGTTLTRDDLVIILGDFGGIWGLDEADAKILAWYETRGWTTLFIDGNHENHDALDCMDVTERFGGPVHVIPGFPHVIHLMRGIVYDLPTGDGTCARTLVMGGARSQDRQWRVEGESWWAREMPSEEEYVRCRASLEACGWSVDYVLTHDVPRCAQAEALAWDYERWGAAGPAPDELTVFLQEIEERIDHGRLKAWYAGHYHRDMRFIDDRHAILYRSVLPLGEFPGA